MKVEGTTVDRKAAKWLLEQEEGLTAEQEAELTRWLAADAGHRAAYDELKRVWSCLDRIKWTRHSARLEAELDGLPFAQRSGVVRRSGLRIAPLLAGTLAAGLIVVLAYFAWPRPMPASPPYFARLTTPPGGVRSLTLPDHSGVWLNNDSALELHFTSGERRAHLRRGEAFFSVAKDPTRPFLVDAAGVEVRAVGTRFNVRLEESAIEVTVQEGKVAVDNAQDGRPLLAAHAALQGGAAPLLVAGQRLVLPVNARPMIVQESVAPTAVSAQEIERSLAWRNPRLMFESAPLSTIVSEFNRRTRKTLIVDDAELAERRFGGTFEANDPKTFLEMLCAGGEIVAEERGEQIVLRRRR